MNLLMVGLREAIPHIQVSLVPLYNRLKIWLIFWLETLYHLRVFFEIAVRKYSRLIPQSISKKIMTPNRK
jgi:hypothetical protein